MSTGETVVWCVAIFCATILLALVIIALAYRSVEKEANK